VIDRLGIKRQGIERQEQWVLFGFLHQHPTELPPGLNTGVAPLLVTLTRAS
jgi:hypothetical protein